MKKLITILAFVATNLISAQEGAHVYFSANVDAKNAVFGSDATNHQAKLNTMFKFGMVSNKKVEVAMGYETFPALDFDRYFFSAGKQFEIIDNLVIVPSVEPSIINRYRSWGGALGYNDNASAHLSIGVAMPTRYSLNDNFAVEAIFDALLRTDNMAKFGDSFKVVPSVRLGIVLKIPVN